jgi:hypothetical protein
MLDMFRRLAMKGENHAYSSIGRPIPVPLLPVNLIHLDGDNGFVTDEGGAVLHGADSDATCRGDT